VGSIHWQSWKLAELSFLRREATKEVGLLIGSGISIAAFTSALRAITLWNSSPGSKAE
jgi:hypothetical protein